MAENSCSSVQIIASRTVVNIKLFMRLHHTKVFQIKVMGMFLHARWLALSFINYNSQMYGEIHIFHSPCVRYIL